MWLSFTQFSIFSPQIRLCGTTLLKSPVKSSWNDSSKSYIGLFTCTSTQALHLELTHVQDLLLAFGHFTGRRGLPASIQFKDVPFIYRRNTKDHAIFGSLEVPDKQSNKLEIHCGKGPMVGTLLAKTMRNWDLLTEVEGIINAQLLTYIYDDQMSISQPQTLSYLIGGCLVTIALNRQFHNITILCQEPSGSSKRSKNWHLDEMGWSDRPL